MDKSAKMKKATNLWTTIVFLAIAIPSSAQDPHFSQFYTSPLTQNPALAGAIYDMQGIINYKSQWSSVANPFKTVAASFDMKFVKKKIKNGYWAGGVNLFNDDAGISQLRTTLVNLTVAYHVQLDQFNSLGAGLQGGICQRSINFGALQWGSQYNGMNYDASLPSNEPSGAATHFFGDAGAGVVWAFNNNTRSMEINDNNFLKWSLGASVFHVNRPNLSFTGTKDLLNIKYVLHGNGLISIPNSDIAFAPGFMFSKQGAATEILYGSLIRYNLQQHSKYTGFSKDAAISLGVFHRWGDAFALTMQLEISGYKLGMSYDINSSELRTASKGLGGFEISICYTIYNPFLSSGRRRR